MSLPQNKNNYTRYCDLIPIVINLHHIIFKTNIPKTKLQIKEFLVRVQQRHLLDRGRTNKTLG